MAPSFHPPRNAIKNSLLILFLQPNHTKMMRTRLKRGVFSAGDIRCAEWG